MTSDQTPPAGWYPDKTANVPAGQQRYWNARRGLRTQPHRAPRRPVAEPARKPGIFTRWGIPGLVGVLALLFGLVIGSAGGSTGEPTPAPEPHRHPR